MISPPLVPSDEPDAQWWNANPVRRFLYLTLSDPKYREMEEHVRKNMEEKYMPDLKTYRPIVIGATFKDAHTYSNSRNWVALNVSATSFRQHFDSAHPVYLTPNARELGFIADKAVEYYKWYASFLPEDAKFPRRDRVA